MSEAQRARGTVPQMDQPNLWRRIWEPFWTLPLAIVLVAGVAASFLPSVDQRFAGEIPWVIESGPDGARSVLTTIASAMISVTGLVFSITMVVLQLASSQYTPRLMSGFLSSRITQATLGLFAASFVYSLIVLRAVRGSNADGDSFVPQLSVSLAMLIVLAAVGMFIAFIHHIVTSIQVGTVVRQVGRATQELIEEQFGPPLGDDALPGTFGPTWSPRPGEHSFDVHARDRHGRLSHIDYVSLVRLAKEHDVVIVLQRGLGTFIADGQVLATVWGDVEPDQIETRPDGEAEIHPDEAFARTVKRSIGISRSRSMMQDIGFGFRQLVDIADRALSPGTNDPTTAIETIDELHHLLRLLAVRPSISPFVADDDGVARLVHRPVSFAGVLGPVVDEIGFFGRDDVQVPGRLLVMLEDLDSVARSEYREAIAEKRHQVQAWEGRTDAPAD